MVFPTPPLFDASLRENPSEFLDETYPHKNYRDGTTVWWKMHA